MLPKFKHPPTQRQQQSQEKTGNKSDIRNVTRNPSTSSNTMTRHIFMFASIVASIVSATLDNTPILGTCINNNATSCLQPTPELHTGSCTARDTASFLIKVGEPFIDGAGCEPIKATLKDWIPPYGLCYTGACDADNYFLYSCQAGQDDTTEIWIGGGITPIYGGLLNKALSEAYPMVTFDGLCPNCGSVVSWAIDGSLCSPGRLQDEVSEDAYNWKEQVCKTRPQSGRCTGE